jgi:yeast amino acid transporter
MYLENGERGRFLGLWNSCCQAIFSYLGVEAIGIVADECERPKEVLPGAVRRISYRVMIYYIGAVAVLGLNLSPNDPILQLDLASGATSSPFALMFDRAGVPVLRNLINACALIASVSSANASLYIGVSPYNFSDLTFVEPHTLCSRAGGPSP